MGTRRTYSSFSSRMHLLLSLVGALLLASAYEVAGQPSRKIKETIISGNGTVTKKIEEVYFVDGQPVTRGVIEDGPFGGNGGGFHTCEWESDDTVIIVQGRAGKEVDEIE